MDEFKKFRTNGKMEDIVAELKTFGAYLRQFSYFEDIYYNLRQKWIKLPQQLDRAAPAAAA